MPYTARASSRRSSGPPCCCCAAASGGCARWRCSATTCGPLRPPPSATAAIRAAGRRGRDRARVRRRDHRFGGGFLTAQGTMTLAFANAYGGSTVVYTGTSLTAPKRVITGWGVPGVTHADLLARSQRYLDE